MIRFDTLRYSTTGDTANHTLGEVAEFVFTLLGSYWDAHGFDAAIRKSYTDEKTKTEYSKYSLTDGKSEMSKVYLKFWKDVTEKYHAMTAESFYMLKFPIFLQTGIAEHDTAFSCEKKRMIMHALTVYIGCAFGEAMGDASSAERQLIFERLTQETYRSILSVIENKKAVRASEIGERATWTTIETLLDDISQAEEDFDKKSVSQQIVRHSLFIRFCRAMNNAFGIGEDEMNMLQTALLNKNYLGKTTIDMAMAAIDEQLLLCASGNGGDVFLPRIEKDPYALVWLTIESPPTPAVQDVKTSNNDLILACAKYFINSYTQVQPSDAKWRYDQFIERPRVKDGISARFHYNWYKARTLIFTLNLDGSEEDKKQIDEALGLLQEAFDKYKYCVGRNIAEFLSDAIVCDVYFRRPEAKTVMANVQDDTGKSSIKKPGKSYWEFAHAVGILEETSKETYLVHYNAAINFWHYFPAPKFANTQAALARCEGEMLNRELRLPVALEGKKAVLPAARRQEVEGRWYTNMNIAIMTGDWDFVKDVLRDNSNGKDEDKNQDKDKSGKSKLEGVLSANDESGATPLIRALYEYRLSMRGYTADFRKRRAEVLSRYDGELQKCWRIIAEGKYKDCDFLDEKHAKFEGIRVKNIRDNMVKEYYGIVGEELRRSNIEDTMSAALSMLHPIIMDMIAKTPLDAITDEAHTLDTEFCVSALQLAIDCRDIDFVKAIVEKLKQADKWQGGTLYISEDYLTPLQYAILQYDYLVQFNMMLGCGKIRPLEIREIPHRKIATGGIQKEDRDFYTDRKIERRIRALPEETAGLYIARGTPRSLLEIIKYLAGETNPISVDTFYCIADLPPMQGVAELVRYMIDTGHVDLCGTNFEWDRGIMPQETLLAKCIRIRNYDLVRLLLEEYPEKFKNIINECITDFGMNLQGEIQFKHETDLHFFVLNQIESAKVWHHDKKWHSKKEQDDYGKQIAHTLSTFLPLFKKAGARFDIPDAKGKTVADYLREWKDKFPSGSIPEDVEAVLNGDNAS